MNLLNMITPAKSQLTWFNLFDNITKWFLPPKQVETVWNADYQRTWKTTSELMASWEIPYKKTNQSLFPAKSPMQDSIVWKYLQKLSKTPATFSPLDITGRIEQWANTLSQWAWEIAQTIKQAWYSDWVEQKKRKIVESLVNAWYDNETIAQVYKQMKDEWKMQGSWFDNPVTGTLASVASSPFTAISWLEKWIADVASWPRIWAEQDTLWQAMWTAYARWAKWTIEAWMGSLWLATSWTIGWNLVNTAFTSDTVAQPMEKYMSAPIRQITAQWQQALWFNPESQASQDIQETAWMTAPLAILWAWQKYVAPKIPSIKWTVEWIKAPFVWTKEVLTRKIPVWIMERDLSLTPTERANIENINWKPAWAVALEYNLPKDKQAMADTLSTKADEAYNGITSDLKKVTARSESLLAKEMLGIMLDEMSSSKILSRTMKPYMDKLNQMLQQSDYSLSEKNAIRRDFDRIVANKIFDSKWRVSGIEDKAIENIREGLSSELQSEALKYWIDIKAKNDILRTSIALRDWVLRRLSQENKNNKIWLQDIWVWAILSAGEPLTAAWIIFGKKLLESQAPSIAQRLYSSNKTPYATNNLKRGVTITPRDTTNGLSITPDNGTSVRIPIEVKKPTQKKATTKPRDLLQEKYDAEQKNAKPIIIEIKPVTPTPVKEVTPKKITPTEKVSSTQANWPTVIGKMWKVGKKTTPQSPVAYELGSMWQKKAIQPKRMQDISTTTPRWIMQKFKDNLGIYSSMKVENAQKRISEMWLSESDKKMFMKALDETPKWKDYNLRDNSEFDAISIKDLKSKIEELSWYKDFKVSSIAEDSWKVVTLHRWWEIDKTWHWWVFFTDNPKIAKDLYWYNREVWAYDIKVPDTKDIKSYRSVIDAYLDVAKDNPDTKFFIARDLKANWWRLTDSQERMYARESPSIMRDYWTTGWMYDFNRKLDKVVWAEMKKRWVKLVEYTNTEDLWFSQQWLEWSEFVVYDKSIIQPKSSSSQATWPRVLWKMGKVETKTQPQSATAYEQGMRRPYTLQANKPIVKRASDSTKPIGVDKPKSIPVKNPLVEEARKYKSADEFIDYIENNKDLHPVWIKPIIYRWEWKNYSDNFMKLSDSKINAMADSSKDAVSFATSKTRAKEYWNVSTYIVDKNAKIANLIQVSEIAIKNKIKWNYSKALVDKLKELWYDWYSHWYQEVVIINPKSVINIKKLSNKFK